MTTTGRVFWLLAAGLLVLTMSGVAVAECGMNIDVDEVPDDYREDDVGGYVEVNADDDNPTWDDARDRDEDPWTCGEDELIPIYLVRAEGEPEGTIILRANLYGDGHIRVWEESDRTGLLIDTEAGPSEYHWVPDPGPGEGDIDDISEDPNYPLVLWVEGLAASDPARDVELEFEWQDHPVRDPPSDTVRITVVRLDLDIDSNNDNGFDEPDRDASCGESDPESEDTIEYHEGKPGKIIGINDDDDDEDGIPDFADGFDLDDESGTDDDQNASEDFVAMVVEISEAVDLENASLYIDYEASDPGGMSVPAEGAPYQPASGALRIWTKAGNEERNSDNVESGGDYVAPGSYYDLAKLGFSSSERTVTFYVEGIEPSGSYGDQAITWDLSVDVPAYGDTYYCWDGVRVTVLRVDVDVDSDNDDGLGYPERDDTEDQMEDRDDLPGKILGINDDNDDADSNDLIPDFADGFNWDGVSGNEDDQNAQEEFLPLVLELSDAIDVDEATITITYNASDPADVTRTGNEEDGYEYTPGAGALRLWLEDGSVQRDKDPVLSSGDYVAPDTYDPGDLGLSEATRTVTLYVEGIAVSDSLGDRTIHIEVDPDGSAGPCGPCSDYVRLTLVGIEVCRGEVEEETGRGAIGPGNEVLTPINPNKEVLPPSDPVPNVVLETVTVSNISENAEDRLVADVAISGYVTSALADIVPDSLADPTEATVIVADREVATIDLTRVAETGALLRPYAAHYTFSETLTAVPVVSYKCGVRVEVEDFVTGNVGQDTALFNILAARESPEAVPSMHYDNGLVQPLKLQVDTDGPWASLEELAAAGPEAISVLVKRAYISDDDPLARAAGLDLPPGENPVIQSPDGAVEIEITDTSNMGLSDAVQGTFPALVRVPDRHPEEVEVLFEETAPDSNLYNTRYVEAVLTLSEPLDPESPDTVSAQVRTVYWDTPGSWESDSLVETDDDSREFGTGSFVVTIVEMSELSAGRPDEMTLAITNSALGLTSADVDVAETGNATLVFDSEAVFEPLPLVNEYSEVWLDGPWTAVDLTHHESTNPGAYVPLVIRIRGPVDVADSEWQVEIFDTEHGLVEVDGVVYSAGSGEPGNFANVGNLKVGDPFGAGHISQKEGFVWAELSKTQPIARREANIHMVHGTLFWEMAQMGAQRHTARVTAANPGSVYWPPTYTPATDPRDKFVDVMWTFFEEAKTQLGETTVNEAVRLRALKLMTGNDPEVAVIGLPHSPNMLLCRAADSGVTVTGSKHLIGHWNTTDVDFQTDFAQQAQNITDIIHFNTGLGWGDLKGRVTSLQAVLEATYGSDKEKSEAIMNWMRNNNYLDILTESQRERLASMGDHRAFTRYVSRRHQWKELVDIFRMAKAFGGSTVTALDFFLAYDIASGEAFHVFGIDPLNDVISTEAGARLGEELANAGSTIVDKPTLKTRMERHFADARDAFMAHPVMSRGTYPAFQSVMFANDGTQFIPVKIKFGPDYYTIWGETLATVLQKNKAKLRTHADCITFVNKFKEVIGDMSQTSYSGPEMVLTPSDVRELHRAIEVLSLIYDE